MAILSAPNLVFLSVCFNYPSDTRQLDHNNRTLGTLNFYTAKRLPKIEVLDLYGYTVGLRRENEMEHRIQTSALRELTLIPGPGSNLQNFLETLMNSGELHLNVLTLRYRFPCTLASFARTWDRSLTDFLQHFKGLKELIIEGHVMMPLDLLGNGIGWHGETLEELTLHNSANASALLFRSSRQVENAVRDVENLLDTCPRLRNLTLDIYFGYVSRHSHRYTNQPRLTLNDSELGTPTNLPAFPDPGKACHPQPTLRPYGEFL